MTRFHLLDDASLQGRNTFRVPARASVLADIRHPDGLAELFEQPWTATLPVLVLGSGSNILFAGDFPGLAITIHAHGARVLQDDKQSALIRAEAGELWNDFVQWSVGRGFTGLENLSSIPGTVGAAPIQNIGAYGVEVSEFIENVEAFDRGSGRLHQLPRVECAFGYRDSLFKQQPERWIVTAVEFRLRRDRPLSLDYAGIREELATLGADTPRAPQVAEAIARLRARKLPDPALIGNAGSFFKNPLVEVSQAELLRKAYPGLPVFPGDNPTRRKLSAAWMIERRGWKGYRQGDTGVSERHALVLVNHGHATGREILELAQRIGDDVKAAFGMELEPEPRIIGAAGTSSP